MGRFIKSFFSVVVTVIVMAGVYYMAYAIFMTLFPNTNIFVVNMGMIFSAMLYLFITILNKIEKLYEVIKYHDIRNDIKEYQKEHQDRIKSLIDALNK